MAKPGSLNFNEQPQSQGVTMQRDERHIRLRIYTAINSKVFEPTFFDSTAPSNHCSLDCLRLDGHRVLLAHIPSLSELIGGWQMNIKGNRMKTSTRDTK